MTRDNYWPERYRPKYPNSPFVHIADIVDPETGLTYREKNHAKTHKIPVGTLVQFGAGSRLTVTSHDRDCDGTPLYGLGFLDDLNAPKCAVHGYDEESLKVVE